MLAFEGSLSHERAVGLPLAELLRLARDHKRYTDEIRKQTRR